MNSLEVDFLLQKDISFEGLGFTLPNSLQENFNSDYE